MEGVPPEVSTVMASLNVRVTSTLSPSVHSWSGPGGLMVGAAVTVGAAVAMLDVGMLMVMTCCCPAVQVTADSFQL